MKPKYFPAPEDFRKWLEKNHEKEDEVLVKFYKKSTGKRTMTWEESVDEALCFGWIDGIRKKIDDESFSQRFTQRRKNSIWSKRNIDNVERLSKEGRMKPKGLEAFSNINHAKTGIYSFEKDEAQFSKQYLKLFKADKKAYKFFESQPPYYKRIMKHWVMSAKQEKTQLSRLEKLIKYSDLEKRIG